MRDFYLSRTFVLLTFILISNSCIFAQKEVAKWIEEVRKNNQFSAESFIQPSANLVDKSGTQKGTIIMVDLSKLADLCDKPRPTLTLTLPIEGRLPVAVELARIQVTTSDFKVSSSSLIRLNPKKDAGVHYRGIVKGDVESVVAISIYHGEVRGFIADKTGKYEIGKIKNTTSEHIIFNEQDIGTIQPFSCASNTEIKPKSSNLNSANLQETVNAGVGCKTVAVYFECDYQMYLDNGSNVANVTNYVTSFFNQVATLYQNENIDIQISEIYVWTTPDPYRSLTSTSSVLQTFDVNRGTNFNGNLAHFLTTRNLGGGVAYLNTLCTKAYAHGVCMVQNTFANYPTYSWTVECVTHEIGHNLGSNHTQWCGWLRPDGTTGPIDNCAVPEGGCTTVGATPTNGGTIMSYCHLTSMGINFANGFGTLPGNVIRASVANATCLTISNVTAAPTGQQTTNITSNSALLSWNAVPNGITYSVDYKLKNATSWTSLGSFSKTTASLIGLSSGISYDWRVKCDCSGYSTVTSFTTTGTTSSCTAPIGLTSSSITSNSVVLKWELVSNATSYMLQYKAATASTWTTAATVISNTFSITGLLANTTYNWQIKANCSTNSTIASFTTLSALCIAPVNLLVSNLTNTTANLSWKAVSGATNYTIQYKISAATVWTTAATVPTTNYNLVGLSAGTNYTWQLKANCSAYSPTANFRTLTVICTSPSGLSTTNITSTSATLVWNSVSGATSYTIQYKATTATSWLTAATISSTNYNLSALLPGTSYNWQVKTNCSAYSTATSFKTNTSSCVAPSILSTTGITNTSATLVWNSVSGATSYTIQYKHSAYASWMTAATVTTTNYKLSALIAGTTYSWRIKANCSPYSATVTLTTTSTTCATPTDLTSTNVAGTSATIAWKLVSGAVSYTIQYQKSTTSTWTTAATVTTNAYSLTSLSKNTTYNWKIKSNCSAYSTIATFKTTTTLTINTFVEVNNLESEKEEERIILPIVEKAKFSIFPNPAPNNITLKVSNEENVNGDVFYQIVDFRGKVRKSQKVTNDNINLEISDLESGIYIIQMVSKLGVVESKTLIKE